MNYGEDYGQYAPQQPGAPKGGVRPQVDPSATGEVDPAQYAAPKESTNKIRGRYDIIEMLCGGVDQELLPVKSFYFFFYSAFGSLFPLMGVYFKQMGMNPGQCGVLIGFRPFIEFLAAPFWGSLADRHQKGKQLLLFSLASWIVFTLPLGFIQPPATSCILRRNATDYVLKAPDNPVRNMRRRREALITSEGGELDVPPGVHSLSFVDDQQEQQTRVKRGARPHVPAGLSPLKVTYASNYDPLANDNWVSPWFSSIVYRTSDIQKAFFLLLLLVIIGEFFAAPAITLADSAVITILGEDADRYGHQRMFGSLGWGLAMFFVGIALDHSTAFPDHPCGPEDKEKNYTICFATFSVLMGAALLAATQINFKYEPHPDMEMPQIVDQAPVVPEPPLVFHGETVLAGSDAQPTAQPQAAPLIGKASKQKFNIKNPNFNFCEFSQTKVFAQTMRKMPEWVTVLKQFNNIKCGSFLFVAWFMGFGIGLIFTFLFWHLQDYGGSPTLFGVASVINHISEIFAYFFSFRLIRQMGHVKVLCVGLVGNVIRFLYISWLKNPWWVLPFEFMQGITHAAVWAACCSYIAHNTPQHLRGSAQGVLQGIHHGLGRGCGAVIGGLFVNYFGTTTTFRGYGVCCLFVLGAFIFINFYQKDTGFVSDLPPEIDPHKVAEETAHLAPHGVPSNPIPRALSSSRLQDMAGNDYGATYQQGQPTLDVPGAAPTNPFRQEAFGQQQYYDQTQYSLQ
ncbi:major facilitator superfamily domain-containing protein 6 isoform X1 [Neocloeon triangulifer]|uniref:major facilitator superfamily domain-containing protein 6 isoform X1 n=1 Tax=Neocloeon triangulifer TaxID=2078957 RepID=UPI00286EEA96|nr:major facilitator superfamily domain-containing protein 6 isoform X1 [Neocloeon triangulifer]